MSSAAKWCLESCAAFGFLTKNWVFEMSLQRFEKPYFLTHFARVHHCNEFFLKIKNMSSAAKWCLESCAAFIFLIEVVVFEINLLQYYPWRSHVANFRCMFKCLIIQCNKTAPDMPMHKLPKDPEVILFYPNPHPIRILKMP